LINLNLLPPNSKLRVRDRAYLIVTKNTVIVLLVLIVVNSVAITGLKYYLEYRTGAIENEIESLKDSQSNTQSLNEAIAFVNQKSSYLKTINDDYIMWSERILDMTQEIPAGITMTTISIDNQAKILALAGKAATRDDLLAYKKQLEKLTYFTNIDLPITNLTTQTDIVFQITATINNDLS
jgi:Tfp pilus assembly protein PilN